MKHILKLKENLKEEGARKIYFSIVNKNAPFYYKSEKAFGFSLNMIKDEDVKNETLKIEFIAEDKFIFQKKTLFKTDG